MTCQTRHRFCGSPIHRTTRRRRQGKILIMLALGLPLVLSLVSFAISVAYLQHARMELGAVIDAAADAAGDTYSSTADLDQAREAAKAVAAANDVLGTPFELEDEDVEFGTFTNVDGDWQFVANEVAPNAVRITGRVPGDSLIAPGGFIPFNELRSVQITRSTISVQLDRDIALVVDRSSSMAFDELEPLPPLISDLLEATPLAAPLGWRWCMAVPDPSRWRFVMVAVDAFLTQLNLTTPQEQVALTTFAEEASLENDLTLDYSLILSGLVNRAQSFCGGASNKAAGIESGADALTDPAFARPDAAKVIVLISDSPYDEGDPVNEARRAAEQGITVHTVSYGFDVDQALMNDIASAGGGTHQHAADVLELIAVLRQIADYAPTVTVPGG